MLRSNTSKFVAGFAAVAAGSTIGWTVLANLPAETPAAVPQAPSVAAAPASPGMPKDATRLPAPNAPADPVVTAPNRAPEAPQAAVTPDAETRDANPKKPRGTTKKKSGAVGDEASFYSNENGIGVRTPYGNYGIRW